MRQRTLSRSTKTKGRALRELTACLTPMLSHLPPVYQEAVGIVDLEGVMQLGAAQQAGVSLSSMKSRVQRGRQQLPRCPRGVLPHRPRLARRHLGLCYPPTQRLRVRRLRPWRIAPERDALGTTNLTAVLHDMMRTHR